MHPTLKARVDRMLRRDVAVGIAMTTAMWIVLAFVFITTSRVVPDRTVVLVLGISAAVLGLFNTASVAALIRCYAVRREHIYLEDISALDSQRATRRARSSRRVGIGGR